MTFWVLKSLNKRKCNTPKFHFWSSKERSSPFFYWNFLKFNTNCHICTFKSLIFTCLRFPITYLNLKSLEKFWRFSEICWFRCNPPMFTCAACLISPPRYRWMYGFRQIHLPTVGEMFWWFFFFFAVKDHKISKKKSSKF